MTSKHDALRALKNVYDKKHIALIEKRQAYSMDRWNNPNHRKMEDETRTIVRKHRFGVESSYGTVLCKLEFTDVSHQLEKTTTYKRQMRDAKVIHDKIQASIVRLDNAYTMLTTKILLRGVDEEILRMIEQFNRL